MLPGHLTFLSRVGREVDLISEPAWGLPSLYLSDLGYMTLLLDVAPQSHHDLCEVGMVKEAVQNSQHLANSKHSGHGI